MMMFGVLFNFPSGWEMAKGIADYAIPFTWFFIIEFWPFWIILIIGAIVKKFIDVWLPDYLERRRTKK